MDRIEGRSGLQEMIGSFLIKRVYKIFEVAGHSGLLLIENESLKY